MPKIGTYSWTPNKVNTSPDPLTPTVTVRPLKIQKERISYEQVHKKPFGIDRKVIYQGSIIPTKHPVKFSAKKITIAAQQLAEPFLFKDNATSNISYTHKLNGFILEFTNHITQDNEGNMWFMSDNGIAKFDGISYYLYNKSSGLPGTAYNSMLFDKQNRLWVNTAEGFFYIKNDSCYVPQSGSFPIEDVQGFHNTKQDNKGNIWFSSRNKGAICYTNKNELLVYDTLCGLPSNYVVDFAFNANNDVFMACQEQGVIIMSKDKIEQILPQQFDFTKSALSVCVKEDTLYVGTWNSGLIQIVQNESFQYSITGNYNERIFHIRPKQNGVYYTIYGVGLVEHNTEHPTLYDMSNGLINRNAFDVFIDWYSNVWVSSLSGGVSRLNENIFLLTKNNKYHSNVFNMASQPESNTMWQFTNGKGLWKTTDSERVIYTIVPNDVITHFNFITNGCIIDDDELWMSTYSSGIAHLKNNVLTFYTVSPIGDDNILYDAARSKDGRIWFAGQQFGLVYYHETTKKFYRIHKGNGALSNRLTTINYFQGNIAFLYETGGMQMAQHESLLNFCINDRLYDKIIKNVYTTKQDITLISTADNGLLLSDKNKQLYQLGTKQGLLSDIVYHVFEDKDGKVWVFTDKGVERIIINNHTVTFDKTIHNHEGAFVSELTNYKFSDKHHHLNILGKKTYYYEAENERPADHRPIINIKGISLNNSPMQKVNSELTLQSKDELKINYNFIFWGQENNYEHYAMLISEKNDTIQFQIGKRGEVALNYLEPNNYKFCIAFRSHHKSFYSKMLVFEVMPHWYNRWWFRAIMLLAGLAIFYYFYTQKRRQNIYLKQKIDEQTQIISNEKKVLEQKNKIIESQNRQKDALIQEIHHRVKNNLQTIIAIIEMQKAEDISEAGVESLSQIAQRISAISLTHEMLFNNDSSQNVYIDDYLHYLIDKIKEASFADTKQISYDLHIERVSFTSIQCTSVGIITSELIYNAIKYAFENIANPKIELHLTVNENNVHFILKDNGKGKTSSRKGLGSRLISIFTRQLNGAITEDNHNGHIVTLNFPLHETE